MPRAQAQAMMSTAMNDKMACGKLPAAANPANARSATVTTAGTKYPVTRSAMRWICADEVCASSTSLMIWFRVVSAPIRLAVNRKVPVVFTVPPMTASPGFGSVVGHRSRSVGRPDAGSPDRAHTGRRNSGPAAVWPDEEDVS